MSVKNLPHRHKFATWLSRPLEVGSLGWFFQRIAYALVHLRIPVRFGLLGLKNLLTIIPYRYKIAALAKHSLEINNKISGIDVRNAKILYASPVGAYGKPFLEKVIKRFEGLSVDYLIFVYDDTSFDEGVFKRCKIIREKRLKWYFMKKYLTPDFCEKYDFIMPWDDDLDILSFDLESFLSVMIRHRLEVAQPALGRNSYYIHAMTLERAGYEARLTDAVEIMAQVFRLDAWKRFWNMLEPDWNHWGWGYDSLGNDLCGFTRTGVIDCQNILHTKEFGPTTAAEEDLNQFNAKYPKARRARFCA